MPVSEIMMENYGEQKLDSEKLLADRIGKEF
jgi:hypothetical protein